MNGLGVLAYFKKSAGFLDIVFIACYGLLTGKGLGLGWDFPCFVTLALACA